MFVVLVLGFAAALAAAVLGALAVPHDAAARALSCDVYAQVPAVDAGTHTASALGGAQNSCASYWTYNLRLVNRSVNRLGDDYGSEYGNTFVVGPAHGCAGAYVHSFMYINVDGTGKSDTSGETSACAY